MSEPSLVPGRIVPAEQANHLPVWTLASFPVGQSVIARRRPQTDADKQAAEEAQRHAEEEIRNLAAQEATRGFVEEPAVDQAEIERIKRAAFDEGYSAGYDHGELAARQEADRLRSLAEASSIIFSRFEEDLAPRLIDMALEIARQIVRRELNSDNAVILAVVRDAFGQLTGGETGKQLLLHPTDVQLVRAHLGEELLLGQWKIVEDVRIEPGGCRICTQQSELDATLSTRWKRTLATLGSTAAWDDSDG